MSASVKLGKANASSLPGVGSIRPVAPGGMYMGDPGLFGDIWGGIKKVGGAVLTGGAGLLTGGPVGAASGFLGGLLGGRTAKTSATPQLPPLLNPRTGTQGIAFSDPRGPMRATPGVAGAAQRFIPGGATGYEYAGPPPSGMRLNKSSYWLKDGTYVPAGTRYVKIRRRNPLNPKALDRAMGRITSAKRASKKLSRVTIRKPASCR